MPSSRAILSDIKEFGLDISTKYVSIKNNGRLSKHHTISGEIVQVEDKKPEITNQEIVVAETLDVVHTATEQSTEEVYNKISDAIVAEIVEQQATVVDKRKRNKKQSLEQNSSDK